MTEPRTYSELEYKRVTQELAQARDALAFNEHTMDMLEDRVADTRALLWIAVRAAGGAVTVNEVDRIRARDLPMIFDKAGPAGDTIAIQASAMADLEPNGDAPTLETLLVAIAALPLSTPIVIAQEDGRMRSVRPRLIEPSATGALAAEDLVAAGVPQDVLYVVL